MTTETGLGELDNWVERARDDFLEGGQFTVHFREELLPGCPLDSAEEIVEPKRVYRLVCTDPPTDADFESVRAEHPDRPPFQPESKECRARGLSVHVTRGKRRALPESDAEVVWTPDLRSPAGAGGWVRRAQRREGTLHVVATARFRHSAEMRGGGGD